MASEIALSLAMIVRNEEELLGRVLSDAAQICDEMIVVDTGSVDLTKDVALAFGARVFDFEWTDDWASARNASFEHCSNDWVLWLDADDRIPEAALAGFLQLKQFLGENPQFIAVRMRYDYTFSASDPSVCLFSSEGLRMVKTSTGLRWIGSAHAEMSIAPAPVIERPEALWTTSAWVEHRTTAARRVVSGERNRNQLEAVIAKGERTPRNLFYLADEYRVEGQHQKATQLYQEGLELCEEWSRADPYQRDVSVSSPWLRYEALVQMAKCAEAMDQPDKKYALLLRALEADSSRAGAFVELGLHHFRAQQWARAAAYFTAASSLSPPMTGAVYWELYTWLPWELLSLCHAEMGMFEEAVDDTVEALHTSPDRRRLFANMEYYLDQLQGKPTVAPFQPFTP